MDALGLKLLFATHEENPIHTRFVEAQSLVTLPISRAAGNA